MTRSGAGARPRILEAAWNLIVERGLAAASMAQVANAAGVSRQALYLHFGSRAGLLVAMAQHRDATSPLFARIRKVRAEAEPSELLAAYFDSWLDYLAEIFPVARLLSAAAVADSEAAVAWDDRMASLRAAISRVMQDLARNGLLARDWTPEAAAEWAWSQTHVDSWRHLVDECGWPPSQAKRQILAALRTMLLSQSATGADRERA